MPEISLSRGGLFSKVSLLLSLSFLVSAFGTYIGAGITSGVVMIVLMIAFFAGAMAVPYMARSSKELGFIGLAGWTFISGLFLGPTIHAYVHILGWQTIFLAYLGTGGVMAVCGILGAFSGINFSRMGWWLTIALLGLIVFGLINIFVSFGHLGNLLYAGVGMVIFAGFFIFDFWRLANSEDTWTSAFDVTMQLYLDYINFLLLLLRFLGSMFGRKD